MKRFKIDYGIDLGTTNSAIARMENGEPVIKKTDTQADTMPSCVGFNRKKAMMVGETAVGGLNNDKRQAFKSNKRTSNYYIEFKRTMGTDKVYESSHMEKPYTSEELSAEVLKRLKSFVQDEPVRAAVITVPAKFTVIQKDATVRAGELAGFDHCELLQEPIAASISYGLDTDQTNGYWVVFDFGGGTFDAALLKVEDGIMKVIDTEGNNYLGGKNLDYAIVDEIFLPYLKSEFVIDAILADDAKKSDLRELLKSRAEEVKIQLSYKDQYNVLTDLSELGEDDEGEEIELDIDVDQQSLGIVLRPIFQKSVDLTRDLLKRNQLNGSDLGALILVGGPTYSPILRKMLTDQIKEPDTSIDPMTAVARGAALYASTVDISEEIREETKDTSKVQLELGYEASTVETEEWVTVKIIPNAANGQADKFDVEVTRGDDAWSSGKKSIDERGDLIEVSLVKGKSNIFNITVFDDSGNRTPCEPSSFTMIQGAVIGAATLPYHIGIEIKDLITKRIVFQPAKGLEKNKSLPAKGVINGLKTPKPIRPGIESDVIKIPIYQGDHGAEGSRAIYNEHVYNAIISGSDLPRLLPENSDVDLTITVNNSEKISLEAYFPLLDYSTALEVPYGVKSEVEAQWLENEITEANKSLRQLEADSDSTQNQGVLGRIKQELSTLGKNLQQGSSDTDRKNEVLDGFRKVMRQLDEIRNSLEWPQVEKDLKDKFNDLEKANTELGDETSTARVNEMRTQVDEVVRTRDIKLGRALAEEIYHLFIQLTYIYQLIGYIKYCNENFNQFNWHDPIKARQLINQAITLINNKPSVEPLRLICKDLSNLQPPEETQEAGGGLLIR